MFIMKLQTTQKIRIRVNGVKEELKEKAIVDVSDNDIDQIRLLKLNWFVEVSELQTTDASTKEIVQKKGVKKI